MKLHPLLLTILMFGSTSSTAADNVTIGVNQRQSVGLTLYNQNLALVREIRELPPMQAGQKVIIEDVSKQLQPETLRIKNAGSILEQNFNARLLSQHALLEYYINKELELARVNPATGAETISRATLLSVDGNQALISRNNRVESIPLNGHWRFIFPSRPAALLTKPNLSFRSEGTGSPRDARISYLTAGLSWTMNYVLTLSADGDSANLSGMASLTNNSGTRYPDASIQLMAGNVNTAPPQPRYKAQHEMAAVALGAAADGIAPPAQMEAFHLYQLPGKVNLEDGQQKQITLLSSDEVSLERTYQHEFFVGAHQDAQRYRIKPNLRLRFDNSQDHGLGQPMPAGNIRVFRPDSQDQLQFVGGAHIDHTADNDPVKITLGQAFDLTVQRHQSQYQKTYNGFLVGQAIRVTNSRNKPATVVIRANFPYEWELEHSSLPMEKISAGAAQWTIEVAGKGDQVLNFTVQMKKPDRK